MPRFFALAAAVLVVASVLMSAILVESYSEIGCGTIEYGRRFDKLCSSFKKSHEWKLLRHILIALFLLFPLFRPD